MTQLASPIRRLYRPNRFGYLMGLYAENYVRLTRMFRPERLVGTCFRSSVGDGLDLRLDVIERHPYTVEMRLTYDFADPVTGQPDPSAFLRLYRDARQVEATHCYVGRRWQDTIGFDASPKSVLGYRLQMNAFLNKWLEYLGEQGHSLATLEPMSGPAIEFPPVMQTALDARYG
jgi:uncharacterized protein YqiB (DUF1249 family)